MDMSQKSVNFLDKPMVLGHNFFIGVGVCYRKIQYYLLVFADQKGGLAGVASGSKQKEVGMDTQDIKKFLSGLCIAGLLAGATLTLAGCPEKPGSS